MTSPLTPLAACGEGTSRRTRRAVPLLSSPSLYTERGSGGEVKVQAIGAYHRPRDILCPVLGPEL
jgi:hypothetical protein